MTHFLDDLELLLSLPPPYLPIGQICIVLLDIDPNVFNSSK